MNIYKKLIILVSLIILSQLVNLKSGLSEPSSVTEYLMNECISMMDWGIFKLEKKLNEKNFKHPLNIDVNYDWDLNRLKIEAIVFKEKFKTKREAKNYFIAEIKKIKSCLGVFPKKGDSPSIVEKIMEVDGLKNKSFLYIYFTHEGFKAKSQPKNLYSELENITEISMAAIYLEDGQEKGIRCKSPLLSEEFFFSE